MKYLLVSFFSFSKTLTLDAGQTYDADGLAHEAQAAAEAHVLGAAARRPQTHQVLHAEEHDEPDFLQHHMLFYLSSGILE